MNVEITGGAEELLMEAEIATGASPEDLIVDAVITNLQASRAFRRHHRIGTPPPADDGVEWNADRLPNTEVRITDMSSGELRTLIGNYQSLSEWMAMRMRELEDLLKERHGLTYNNPSRPHVL